MDDLQQAAVELRQFLESHRADRPEGLYEMELMQHFTGLTLRQLRGAIDRLVAEGSVRRVPEGPRQRIALLS